MNRATEFAEVGRALIGSGLLRPPRPTACLMIAKELRKNPTGVALAARIAAVRWPTRVAVWDESGALTYRELIAHADSAATWLQRYHHVHAGDSIAIMCRNSRSFVIGLLAAARLGADAVLLNTDFRDQALKSALDRHNIDVVVCEDEFANLVDAASPRIRSVSPHGRDWSHAVPPARAEGRLILLTSGTTGTPRGVPRDPRPEAIAGMAASVIRRTALRTGATVVIAVPFFHAFGLSSIVLSLALGGTAVVRRRFDPAVTMALCASHRADALMAVPVMLTRILNTPQIHDQAPPVVVSGGSALLPSVADRFSERFGQVLFNGYGSSEVALATFATPADLGRAPGTVGRPVAGVRVEILDESGQRAPANVIGRIFVHGPSSVDTYTGGATKDRGGSLVATGDLGHIDLDGLVHVLGRDDDMIISGGENVYPRAIEDALGAHPGVADACAVGVPDAEFGQRLVALVVSQANSLNTAELDEYLRQTVSRFERPREIVPVSSIPRNAAGKVDRRAAAQILTAAVSVGDDDPNNLSHNEGTTRNADSPL